MPGNFNDLDDKFQLKPTDDDEKIFEEEYQMIEILRKKYGDQISSFSDKYLVWFLCSRRHNLDEIYPLIEKHLELKKKYSIDENFPSVKQKEMISLLSNMSWLYHRELSDRFGRPIEFVIMRHNNLTSPDERFMIATIFWKANQFLNAYSLRKLRDGFIWVCDMKGFSIFKNINMTTDRTTSAAISNAFPFRIRQVFIINGGILLSQILKLAKYILPSKISSRLKSVDLKELKESIDHIPTYIGGDFEYQLDPKTFLASIEPFDERK